MVIAVSPYGVLKPVKSGRSAPKTLLCTGPRHHLAYFGHRRDDRIAHLIKLDPWRAIRLAKEDRLGRVTHPVYRVIWYSPQHFRSSAGPLQHCIKDGRLNRI